jgi:long-chain acyl-CoA synthetase
MTAAQALDTFPRLLLHNAAVRGDRPAIREKDLGIWLTRTWRETADEVRALACGLAALGFRRGQNLAIVGDNRPRLYWAMAAAQCLGGVPVPMYQDAVADEMAFVLDNAEIEVAIVENQEQVDKLLEVQGRCPRLQRIIYCDPRGMRHYRQEQLLAYDALMERGRTWAQQQPDFFTAAVAQGNPSDTAIILYTSGTTGVSKGVVLSHENMISVGRIGVHMERLTDRDEVLAYLPMAWVGDNLFSYSQCYIAGFCISCPESPDTVAADLREIGPTYYFGPPRVFENLLTQVLIRMEDAGRIKRWAFEYFMRVAKRAGVPLLEGRSVSLADRLLYALGKLFIYAPLRNVLGLTHCRIAYTAGESIGPEIFDFYRSIGINLKQLYGQTEASVLICAQPDGQVKADTVGPPAAGVEVKVDEHGEVLYRSLGVFQCYYKNPEATANTKSADGWVKSGDAGYFDHDGHLKIIDRAKDVGKLSNGTLFAPKYLENKLKFFPHVKEAVVFGDRREFACAMINIDLQAVGNWAERRNLPYSGYTDLAAQPAVYELIKTCVEQVNRDLAGDAKLGNSQIRRFLILHKELDADDGELTRTRKVRRGYISDKYGVLIDALYGGAASCHIETQVKFEDGRTGSVAADLRIDEAAFFPPVPRAA